MKLNTRTARLWAIFIGAALLFLNSACTKSSLIGSEIFPPDDAINVKTTDTLTFLTTTVKGDSVRTYSPTSTLQLASYLVGRLQDPVFGQSTATLYAQLRLPTTSPTFENVTLDSVVLFLPYKKSARNYGVLTAAQTFKVHRLAEAMDETEDIFSNQTFQKGALIGKKTFVPNVTDSLTVATPSGDTILYNKLPPHLRIPLYSSFGNLLLNSAEQLTSTDKFLEFFHGISVSGEGNAMLSFDLNGAGITLYYQETDTEGNVTPEKFDFVINTTSAKSVSFQNIRESAKGNARGDAAVVKYMNNINDSLVFAQGMEGVETKISFPYIENMRGAIVNKAELVVTVADMSDTLLYPLPAQMILFRKLDGAKVVIRDVSTSVNVSSGFALFGGSPKVQVVNGVTFTTYTLNISGILQNMIDGELEENALYISLYPKAQSADRVILCGASHSQFPMKMNLVYTTTD
jgi:hypothetical protein